MFTLFFFAFNCLSINIQVINSIVTISGEGFISSNDIIATGQQKTIIEVNIGEGITEIQEYAFAQCDLLRKVTIPSSVITIGKHVFSRCKSLVSIIVADNNQYYCSDSQGALYNYNKTIMIRAPAIENIQIPDTVEIIATRCFSTNREVNMKNIKFPNSLKKFEEDSLNEARFEEITYSDSPTLEIIDDYTCSYMRASSLMIPKSCITIGNRAFISSSFDNIVFQQESSLTEIKSLAFSQITTLTKLILPESLVKIDTKAFQKSSIEYVYIGELCDSIAIDAFSMCDKLQTINISVNNKNYSSFEGNIMDIAQTTFIFIPQGLTNISFPSTLQTIGSTLLQSQNNLIKINLPNKDIWDTEAGVLYSNDFTKLILVCGGVTLVSVHASVKIIEEKALYGCKNIKEFTFLRDDLCESINSYSFSTSNISSIIIPKNVKTLGTYAFQYCTELINVTIPKDSQLSSIGSYCFDNSNIQFLYIPEKVSDISFRSFASTKNLEKVEFSENSITKTFQNSAFSDSTINRITIPKSIEVIKQSCFECCTLLEEVIIPQESLLQQIDTNAFYRCSSLKNISLPQFCKNVSSGAFSSCNQLSTFTHFIEEIEANVFQNDIALLSFTISSETTYVNPYAFLGCTNLIEFKIDQASDYFSIVSGFLYNKTGDELILAPPGLKKINLSKETSSISDLSFKVSEIMTTLSLFSGY